MSQDTPSFLLGREPINSGWSTDVCFGAHSELQSDIAPCPTSALFRTHALRQKHATQSPRRHAREILCIGIARACTAPKVQEGSAAVAGLRRRANLPRSQQRLPRAGQLELSYSRLELSYSCGAPYGVTHTHFAVASGSALASKSPPCWEAKIPPRSHECLEFDYCKHLQVNWMIWVRVEKADLNKC
jgi:hypothetical protein